MKTPVWPASWKARMRWSGTPRPTWMSGEVTSMPSLTRSGRPSASLRSSSPFGRTSTSFVVSCWIGPDKAVDCRRDGGTSVVPPSPPTKRSADLREGVQRHREAGDEDDERARRGEQADEAAVEADARERALREHGEEPDARDREREPGAEGDDQDEPERDPVQR